eukprot:225792-Chlamydomonas_euryale.AAC.1
MAAWMGAPHVQRRCLDRKGRNWSGHGGMRGCTHAHRRECTRLHVGCHRGAVPPGCWPGSCGASGAPPVTHVKRGEARQESNGCSA